MDSAVALLLEGLAALVCCCTANREFSRPKDDKNPKSTIPLQDGNQVEAAGSPSASENYLKCRLSR
ncbi:hypothetical protein N7516_010602 [Penicillium verrucosum]|uniref:uncharacterized protein n=1 Tax=Penicillium verrucosum TaxID=60171 RepID=UPI0025459684|nr:uncharacterized protein N7516_010602 [Penicillium verrucosum]KAJ5922899.1 hypothetical protein N7516_010602 [Penicillium verrucosum]